MGKGGVEAHAELVWLDSKKVSQIQHVETILASASEIAKNDWSSSDSRVISHEYFDARWKEIDPLHDNAFLRFLRSYYFPFLLQFNKHVCMAWLAVFVVSVIFGPKFLSSTRSNLDVPAGTPSEAAVHMFSENYPDASRWPPAIILFHSTTPGQSVINGFTRKVSKELDTFAKERSDIISDVAGYWKLIESPQTELLAYRSVSQDNRTALVTVSFAKSTSLSRITDAVYELLQFASSHTSAEVTVSCTGAFPLLAQMSQATAQSLLAIDAVVLPIAVIILALTIRSYRHIGVALCNLVCSLLLAVVLLVPVSQAMDINPFTPAIMQSISIAACFDYSLFMLTRFREERMHKSRDDAVFACLSAAGHVVCLSGLTLLAAFLVLLSFPHNFLVSVGAGCATAVFTAVLCNMTLTPAMLLAFKCLSRFDLLPSRHSFCCLVQTKDDPAAPAAPKSPPPPCPDLWRPEGGGDDHNGSRTGSGVECGVRRKGRSRWFWLADLMTRYAAVVFLITAGVTVPLGMALFRVKPTSDDGIVYVQGSQSKEALGIMSESFPLGSLDPYSIVLTTGRPGAVLTEEYFALEQAMIAKLLRTQAPKYISAETVRSLSFYRGHNVSLAEALKYLNPAAPAYRSVEAGAYRLDAGVLVNYDRSASMVHIETLVAPTSEAIVPFILDLRRTIDAYSIAPSAVGGGNGSANAAGDGAGGAAAGGASAAMSVGMHLIGGYTATMDAQNAVYAMVPMEVAVTMGLLMLLVGSSFGSVGVALRLVMTILIDLCWAYGLMVIIYQPGPDQDRFAQITPSLKESIGIYWSIPVMAFSILVGLALDYDIFLMTRIVEFRRKGWSDRAAVCLAIERTAGIITAAGLIMCIAFGGLFVPKIIVLNQYGFALFIGVIIDAFFTRPMLVPAIIASRGVNWWPMRMPPVALSQADEARALAAGLWEPCLVDDEGRVIATAITPARSDASSASYAEVEAPVLIHGKESAKMTSEARTVSIGNNIDLLMALHVVDPEGDDGSGAGAGCYSKKLVVSTALGGWNESSGAGVKCIGPGAGDTTPETVAGDETVAGVGAEDMSRHVILEMRGGVFNA